MQIRYKDLPESKVKTATFRSLDKLARGDILVIEQGDIPPGKRFLFNIHFMTQVKKLGCEWEAWEDQENKTEVYEFKGHS